MLCFRTGWLYSHLIPHLPSFDSPGGSAEGIHVCTSWHRVSPSLHVWHRGSYTSGHFIWNLWNSPKASFINFIWNDHACKILFIIWLFKWDCVTFKNDHYFNKKMHCWHECCRWQFLWLSLIHWITIRSYDKFNSAFYIFQYMGHHYPWFPAHRQYILL